MEITIDKLSYGGAGVGRVDGKVVFVEGGVPGDKLKIKLVEEKESYSRAEIEDFIVRSEKRTEPECKFFTNCGGCNWQDVNYKTQLIEKQQIVSDSLQRIGKLAEYELDDIAVSPKEYGYRNRVLLTVFKENDEYRIGYFEEGSDQNISIDRCVIASDEINGVISVLIKYFENNKTLIIPFDKIYLLSSYKKISISFLQSEKSHKSESQEIVQNIIEYIEKNLDGISLDHRLEFEFMGYQFTSSPYLFNQANYEINKEIIHTVAGWSAGRLYGLGHGRRAGRGSARPRRAPAGLCELLPAPRRKDSRRRGALQHPDLPVPRLGLWSRRQVTIGAPYARR